MFVCYTCVFGLHSLNPFDVPFQCLQWNYALGTQSGSRADDGGETDKHSLLE